MAKKYEIINPVQTPSNPRADLSMQERKEFEGKMKLENKLIDRGHNYLLKVNIKTLEKDVKSAQS